MSRFRNSSSAEQPHRLHGEEIEIYVELDVSGSYIQDCEVCCNPWTVRVSRDGEEL